MNIENPHLSHPTTINRFHIPTNHITCRSKHYNLETHHYIINPQTDYIKENKHMEKCLKHQINVRSDLPNMSTPSTIVKELIKHQVDRKNSPNTKLKKSANYYKPDYVVPMQVYLHNHDTIINTNNVPAINYHPHETLCFKQCPIISSN